MSCCLTFTALQLAALLQILAGPAADIRASACRSTDTACAAWARSSTPTPSPPRSGPSTSLPMRAIVSAMSTMPSRSTTRSPGRPHRKYSFTCCQPFLNASRQPSYRSSFLIFLRICSRMSSRATSGASVRPLLRTPLHQLRQRAQLVVDAQARQRDVDAQRREHLVHPLDQLLEVRDNRWC